MVHRWIKSAIGSDMAGLQAAAYVASIHVQMPLQHQQQQSGHPHCSCLVWRALAFCVRLWLGLMQTPVVCVFVLCLLQLLITSNIKVRSLTIYGDVLVQPQKLRGRGGPAPTLTMAAASKIIIDTAFVVVKGPSARFTINQTAWDNQVVIYLRRCVWPWRYVVCTQCMWC